MAPKSYKSVHWFALLAAFLGGSILTYWALNGKPPFVASGFGEAPIKSGTPCDYTISRVKGYEFVRPLLSAEPDCISAELTQVQARVSGVIDSLTTTGAIKEASVYVHEFEHWTTVFNQQDRPLSPRLIDESGVTAVMSARSRSHPGPADHETAV
jgi:hypothetical protein